MNPRLARYVRTRGVNSDDQHCHGLEEGCLAHHVGNCAIHPRERGVAPVLSGCRRSHGHNRIGTQAAVRGQRRVTHRVADADLGHQ